MTKRKQRSDSSRRERRAFTDEFKQEAVRLMHERRATGWTLTQVGRELDVRPDQLREWARRLADREGGLAAAGVVDNERQLARGPGRLAVCLGLDLDANGEDVTEAGGRLVVRMRPEGSVVPAHRQGPRVGVAGAGGDAARHPWRFWLAGEPTVSAYRPAYRSPASGNAPGGATTPA